MKLKHIWSVLCRRSIIDQETNNISLNDVLEQLTINIRRKETDTAVKEINIPIEFEIVSMWVKDSSDSGKIKCDLNTQLILPSGEIMKEFYQKIELPPEKRRIRTRMKILGLPIRGSGDYKFKVSVKDESQVNFTTIVELPLEIKLSE